MNSKLSPFGIIRADSIASEGNGITHQHCIVDSFCFVLLTSMDFE